MIVIVCLFHWHGKKVFFFVRGWRCLALYRLVIVFIYFQAQFRFAMGEYIS